MTKYDILLARDKNQEAMKLVNRCYLSRLRFKSRPDQHLSFEEEFALLKQAYQLTRTAALAIKELPPETPSWIKCSRARYFYNAANLAWETGQLNEALECANEALKGPLEKYQTQEMVAIWRSNLDAFSDSF